MQRFAGLVTLIGVLAGSPLVATAQVLDAAAGTYVTGEDEGPQDGTFDSFVNPGLASVVDNGYSSFRGAMEFDVSTIPSGATVTSATLQMFVNQWEGER